MKFKNIFLSAVGLTIVTTASAIPTPVNVTVSGGAIVVASSDLSDYGDSTVLAWTSTDIANYNTLAPASYPDGSVSRNSKTDVSNGGDSIQLDLSGTDQYVFLHWGGKGGGWAQLFYVGGLSGDFTFNNSLIDNGAGHPDVGGLSFYSYYDATTTTKTSVPDGGSTMLMLGAALSGLGLIVRRVKQ